MDFLPENILRYAEKYTSSEPAVLQELTHETHQKVLYPQMLSGHIQGRLLSFISKMISPSLILEVGTYTGYSAICLAEGLKAGGMLVTIDINSELQPYHEKYFSKAGIRDRIEILTGDAREILRSRNFAPDLVFIDADKQSYLEYYQTLLPQMPSGAVILADNMLWSGRVLDPSENDKETTGLRDFCNFVAADPRVETLLLPVRDGIMLVRKK